MRLRWLASLLVIPLGLAGVGAAPASTAALVVATSPWSIGATPNPAGATDSTLVAVSCSSPSGCTAVGSGGGRGLAERWNGASWRIQATPSASSLSAVSCPSATACITVGACGNGAPLAANWNGSAWSVLRIPPIVGQFPGWQLDAVSCSGPQACTAVGSRDAGQQTLAERWNGRRWTLESTANPTSPSKQFPNYPQLTGVACTAADNCVATGDYLNARADYAPFTLAERWNGTTWRIMPTPKLAFGWAMLNGLACSSANACTAVGTFTDKLSGSGQLADEFTFAERWNGTVWRVEPTPNPPDVGGVLSSVACATATTCVAVGAHASDAGVTLAEDRGAAGWHVVQTADPPVIIRDQLLGVSCPGAGTCVAVGGYTDILGDFTLAERGG